MLSGNLWKYCIGGGTMPVSQPEHSLSELVNVSLVIGIKSKIWRDTQLHNINNSFIMLKRRI